MPNLISIMKCVAAGAVVTVLLVGASTSLCAADGQIYIMLLRTKSALEGSGNLFYKGQRYRIDITGIGADALEKAKVNLTGTVSHLQSAGEIVGTYTAATDGGASIVADEGTARLQNPDGTVLELRGVNIGKSPIDLAGMTIASRGWHAYIGRGSYPK